MMPSQLYNQHGYLIMLFRIGGHHCDYPGMPLLDGVITMETLTGWRSDKYHHGYTVITDVFRAGGHHHGYGMLSLGMDTTMARDIIQILKKNV